MKKFWKLLAVGGVCLSLAGENGMLECRADIHRVSNALSLVAVQTEYENIAVSQVSDYVNIREQATTASAIVGKIYNNCAARILETVEGEGGSWYRIQSGTVTGYMKAEYFITGADAEKLAQSIGREYVTIQADSLRLREEPNLDSSVLTMLTRGARYLVACEEGDFYKVEIDTDLVGYVARAYCKTEIEFDQAVSLEEEKQKLAEEEQRRQDADAAIAALEQVIRVEENRLAAQQSQMSDSSSEMLPGQLSGSASETQVNAPQTNIPSVSGSPAQSVPSPNQTGTPTTGPFSAPGTELAQAEPGLTQKAPSSGPSGSGQPGNAAAPSSEKKETSVGTLAASGPVSSAVATATRTAIVAYAKQFLGNPYVYGGTSLTTGADCSGFTQAIFAHFGITTGRSSRDQAAKGRKIEVSKAQPGDLMFYGSKDYINHVAIYIGDGKVIHSSNSRTGVIISPYNYRTPCKAVTFLD